jgi:hypothetical protein
MSVLPEFTKEQYDRQTAIEREFGPRQPVDPYPNIRIFDGVQRAIIGDRIYEYQEGCVGAAIDGFTFLKKSEVPAALQTAK